MSYYFTKVVEISFESAIARVTDKLKEKGFGVLTEIPVSETLKEKIGVDFPKYRILGACSPKHAHRALLSEPRIGLMLPCNIIVYENSDGKIEVSAIDPMASMMAVKNESLGDVASEIRTRLNEVIEGI